MREGFVTFVCPQLKIENYQACFNEETVFFQVWDVVATEGLANFRGHTSRVFCCIWGNEADLILTGGEIIF